MIEPIPYLENSADLFACVANDAWAVFLDSCCLAAPAGRFDVIAFQPKTTLQAYANHSLITHADGTTETVTTPALDLLKALLTKHKNKNSAVPAELPFRGGAIGYFSYDLCRTLEKLPNIAADDCEIPLMQIGFYDTFIVVDHHIKSAWFVTDTGKSFSEIFFNVIAREVNPFKLITPFKSNFTKETYATAFKKIKNYIFEGDCYQVNLSQRFSASFTGTLFPVYQQLRKINPAPYAAYLNLPQTTVMSFSPEQFIHCEANQVSTSPIKGTRPRDLDPIKDAANKTALQHSEKDHAENLMIVDLLRNDLGRVCEYGSINVKKLFSLESFANVHHLISTIEGRLRPSYSSIDLLQACFPGGSITGAPKIRAMEIIEELEPNRRNIYCGNIGFINYDGDMNLNIAIRTLYTYKNKIYCTAGGAIVADSEVDTEYQECLDKVKVLLTALSH